MLSWLFYAANLLALSIWAMLIFAPKARLTWRVASGLWPLAILTAYYLVNLVYTLVAQPTSALSRETLARAG